MGLELAKAFVSVRADASHVGPDLRGAQPGIEQAIGGMSFSIGGLTAALAGLAGVGATVKAMFTAGTFEQTVIAFETMIGSVKETQDTLANLTEFAAKTPFEMPEILQAARGLIQFGERGQELMGTLNMLGNAASGTSTSFGMVALIFNQIRGVGKLLTQDFRQLSTRGIISLADIAKYYKVSTEEAQKMLSAGKITFEEFRKIMAGLSGEGGRFANLMEKQSHSYLGLWSTFKDEVGLVSRAFGEQLLPMAKEVLIKMISLADIVRVWVNEHKELVKGIFIVAAGLTALTVVIMAYKAAMALAARWTMLMQALAGPAGWAKVAAGLVVFAVATTTVANAMASAEEKAKAAAEAINDVRTEEQKLLDLQEKKSELQRLEKERERRIANFKYAGLVSKLPYGDTEISSLREEIQRLEKEAATRKDAQKAKEAAAKKKLLQEGPPLSKEEEERVKKYDASWSKLNDELTFARYNYSELDKELYEFGLTAETVQQKAAFRENLVQRDAFKAFWEADEKLKQLSIKLDQARRGLTENQIEAENLGRTMGVASFQVQFFLSQLNELDQVTGFNTAKKQLEDLKMSVIMLANNWTEAEKAAYAYAKNPGVTAEQKARYRELLWQQEQWKKFADLKEKAKQLKESIMTPQEDYQKQANEIQDMVRRNLLTEEQAARARVQARKKAFSGEDTIVGRIGILDFGKRIQDALLKRDKQDQMLGVQRDMKKELQEGNKKQERVIKAIENQPRGLT